MSKPLIKIWDIETGFNVLQAFDLCYGERGVSPKQILQERYIISAAFLDHGKSRVRGYAVDPTDARNDYPVVEAIYNELLECDAVVAHYGDKFDMPFFLGRAIYHGFDPLPLITQIDTWKIAKSKFKLNSNKLDYLATYLGLSGKIPTQGVLWQDCFDGDEKAIAAMLKYNKQDVKVLDAVYDRLKPWVPTKINLSLFTEDEICCPYCMCDDYSQGDRYHRTRRGTYMQYKCDSCGAWFTGTVNLNKYLGIKSKVK